MNKVQHPVKDSVYNINYKTVYIIINNSIWKRYNE